MVSTSTQNLPSFFWLRKKINMIDYSHCYFALERHMYIANNKDDIRNKEREP
jgi:hypothetical protein